MSPAIILFVASLLGAYGGLFFHILPVYFFTLSALLGILALLPLQPIAKALSLPSCIALLTAGMAAQTIASYTEIQNSIPHGDVVYQGEIQDLIRRLDGAQTGIFHVTGIIEGNIPRALPLTLNVTFFDGAATFPLRIGDTVRIRGKAKRFSHALAPGEFDPYFFGMARNIHGRIAVKNARSISVFPGKPQRELAANARQFLRERLLQQVTPRETGVLLALIDGDTSLFDDEQRQIYRYVGAGHLLAVSGLQVSLLALFLFRILLLCLLFVPRIGRRSYARPIAAVLAFIFVWAFVILCGSPPSAVRAGAMASAMLLAILFARHARLVDAFGAAGLFSVLFFPACAIDPSFLLSYAAVLGLLLVTSSSHITLQAILTSLAASLVTFPLTAYLFGQVALGGILANIVLVPIAGLIQIPGIFSGLAGAIFSNHLLAQFGANCAGVLEAMCDGMGPYLGHLSRFTISSGWSTILLFISAVTLFLTLQRQPRWLYAGITVTCLSIVIVPNFFSPSGIRITVLPVGQGDSAVFEFPSGQVMIIDGGGAFSHAADPGSSVVLPFLERRGIRKIDVMVVSHPDPDHILGLITVADNMEVGEIWHSGFDVQHPLMKRLMIIAASKDIPMKATRELLGKHALGNSIVEVLAPQPTEKTDLYEDLDVNDNSLVLAIRHGNDSALWPGDIEAMGEERFLHANSVKAVSLVKAPHHGSKTSSTPDFVHALSPRHVIFCTKEDNLFGFPHAPVVSRWHSIGAQLWNTGTDGEITVWLTGSGTVVKPYLKKEK